MLAKSEFDTIGRMSFFNALENPSKPFLLSISSLLLLHFRAGLALFIIFIAVRTRITFVAILTLNDSWHSAIY